MANTGVGQKQTIVVITTLRAFGEIMNVPPPQLEDLLDRARQGLQNKPDTPVGPPQPPPGPR